MGITRPNAQWATLCLFRGGAHFIFIQCFTAAHGLFFCFTCFAAASGVEAGDAGDDCWSSHSTSVTLPFGPHHWTPPPAAAATITVTAIVELQPGQKVSDSLLSLCCMNTKAELLQLQLTPIHVA